MPTAIPDVIPTLVRAVRKKPDPGFLFRNLRASLKFVWVKSPFCRYKMLLSAHLDTEPLRVSIF